MSGREVNAERSLIHVIKSSCTTQEIVIGRLVFGRILGCFRSSFIYTVMRYLSNSSSNFCCYLHCKFDSFFCCSIRFFFSKLHLDKGICMFMQANSFRNKHQYMQQMLVSINIAEVGLPNNVILWK